MLLYFICGMLFYSFIIPCLEELVSIIITKLEVIKANDSLKIAQINAEVEKIVGGQEPIASFPIGFEVPSDTEEDEFYDE